MESHCPGCLSCTCGKFHTELPTHYLYTPSHFWLEPLEPGLWRVGLTAFATRLFGDFVEHDFSVKPNDPIDWTQNIGWIEGFKAVSDIYSMIKGHFHSPNPALDANIALLNSDPYTSGWLYLAKGAPDPKALPAEQYARFLHLTIEQYHLNKQRESLENPR